VIKHKKGTPMKKISPAFFALLFLTACSSPVLKWIDLPGGGNGRIAGQAADKEILSFTFGIAGETDLPIGNKPDETGKIPILVILPAGTDASSLKPVLTYRGKSLSPASGAAGDFRAPRGYTVTAEDDSTRDYLVTVYVKTPESKAIIRFTIALGGVADPAQGAEGIIDEEGGRIFVSVPGGGDPKSLTAHIAHTGDTLLGGVLNQSYDTFTVTNNDFSSPTNWTIVAQDKSEKTYQVTVAVQEKSADKRINHISFGVPGEEVIIGGVPQPDGKYPVLVILPETDSPGAVTIENTAPLVSYTGVSISPGPDTLLNFTGPKIFTITAEDRSTREYVVTVIRKDDGFDSLKQITGFYLTSPLTEGIIDETAKTIALTVPQGTVLSALRPEIYYTGVSVSPGAGQPKDFSGPVLYTVRARDGTTQSYTVFVFSQAPPAAPVIEVSGEGGETVDLGAATTGQDGEGNFILLVELPTYMVNPTININYPDDPGETKSTSTTIINNEVYNTFQAGDRNEYNVVLVNPPPDPSPGPPLPPSTDASIDGFYFTSPPAIGKIGKTDGTEGAGTAADPYLIAVSVPYGTDPRNLAATLCYTGKEIAGIPGPNPLKDGGRSFTNPVDYTVTAEDGTTKKTYRVTVTAAPNRAREISAFSFQGISPVSALISAGPNAGGKYPLVVTVPPGQPLAALSPVITYMGVSIAGPGLGSPAGGPGTVNAASAVDFSASASAPVDYTVTAEDGGTRTYAVTVRNAALREDDIEISGFYFTDPLAVGVVNQNANAITVTVPSNTDTANLKPVVYFKGMSLKPGSGTVQNFSGPRNYTVTGNSGKTRSYTVTVVSIPSSTKDITGFSFPGITGSETIIGAVPGPDGSYPISVWVSPGTELPAAGPDITYTGISVTPGSGTPLAAEGSQTYTVSAEDGSVKIYTATVNTRDADAKLITSLIFEEVPVTGGSLRVAAAIDQSGHVISAELPFSAQIGRLKPTLTYIGKSVAAPTGGDKTVNPFTDTPRDFSGPQKYTVKDQEGNAQEYTVQVIRKSSVAVGFTGEEENSIIRSSAFDPGTGLVTVAVDTAMVSGPFEWYLDGVKQPVSNTRDSFTVNAGDGALLPGRHEVLVSGTKNGLHYTGKVYFTVSGDAK
jgi:hypothetical protein